ncbi:uncharacterized protein GJ701_012287 [Geothlypis trichas]
MHNIPSSIMNPGIFLLLGLLILRAELSVTPEKGGDSQKPGRCPRDFMRCLRLESPLCANDSSCPAGLKCCLWECRLRCIPPAEEKPGACPAAAPEGLVAPCSFPCLEDKDCLGAQKCCPLGCGSACLEPAQGKDSGGRLDVLVHLRDPVCHGCLPDALVPGAAHGAFPAPAAPDSCR